MVDDKGSHFLAKFPDVFADYQNPLLTVDITMANKAWDNWQHAPFSWWECQLNFAVWCAIAGCGVSFEDHLQAEKHPLLASLYCFHVYYMTRRLCDEFGISPDTYWGQKLDQGRQGLGSWSTFMIPSGEYGHVHS